MKVPPVVRCCGGCCSTWFEGRLFMRRFFFGRSWHLAAGAAGLSIVGAMASQMLGVEIKPAKKPAQSTNKKKR